MQSGKYILVGFWEDDERKQEIIQKYQVENWNETLEAQACVFYMQQGIVVAQYWGWDDCRICEEELGFADLETPDHKYLFPELWWHYIEKHNIRPNNEEFIEDAVAYYNEYFLLENE